MGSATQSSPRAGVFTAAAPPISPQLLALPLGVVTFDQRFRISQINPRFATTVGKSRRSCIGKTLDQVAPEFAVQLRELACDAALAGAPITQVITQQSDASQNRAARDWCVTCKPLATGSACFVQETSRDVDDFESFLSDLSARFVNVAPEKVDTEIHDGLRCLVEFLRVDRGHLVSQFSADGTATVIGAYAAPGVPAVQLMEQFRLAGSMPWYVGELMNDRAVRIGSLDALPTSAQAEKEYCQSIGLKSCLSIPISVSGMPLCVLGIATFREERTFSDELVSRLRMVGEVFANAVARRDAKRELSRIQDELAHVTRASTVGQLAASIAHEINQPLCAIQTNAHAASRLLAAAKPDMADVRAALQDIIADNKRASMVVSKAHAMLKRGEVEMTKCSMNDIARDVVLLLHSDALIRRVDLRRALAPKAPMVKCDRIQLQQVIMNLILNAMDSVAQLPGGKREIVLETHAASGAVQVSVHDSGVGLPPEVLAKMFEPFFTTKQQGLGMGLAINRGIIQAHGGKIWAANRSPCGATVSFSLPAVNGGSA